MMDDRDRSWTEYIDQEVRSFCEKRNWQHQIRRKDWAHELPVAESPTEHYEWKVYPFAKGQEIHEGWWLMDAERWDGIYYLVYVDFSQVAFVLQHDTHHSGIRGLHWQRETLTLMRPDEWHGPYISRLRSQQASRLEAPDLPPTGWLRENLLELTTPTPYVKPNNFWKT